jgi:T5SS/PEP-CTERM-associated repeat protein
MGRFSLVRVTLSAFAILALALPLPSARATISATGDVSPTITTWGSSTTGYGGNTAGGAVTIDGGSDLPSYYGRIGYGNTATGVVIVGTGSTWTNSNDLSVADRNGLNTVLTI